MPAACPGDPDYPEGWPCDQENVERVIGEIRERERDLRVALDVSRSHPNAWEVALRDLTD